jgi:hypothetical protein
MGAFERFTRDRVSKFVWGALLLLAVAALVFTLLHRGDAIDQARDEAQQRAVAAVQDVVAPHLDRTDAEAPIQEPAASALRDAIAGSALAEPPVVRLRVWAPSGNLLFSTDREERLDSNAALTNDVVARAAAGTTITRWDLTDVGGVDERGRSLVRTYTPVGTRSVVEVDQTHEGTVGPAESTWLRYQILAGAFVLLFVIMTIASFRDPIERINTGVTFGPSSVPAGYSLIDDERLNAVEEVYRLAHDRVARLQERLEESEASRRDLEGEIQRMRTGIATGARTIMTTATTPSPAAPRPAPRPVVVPEAQPPAQRPPADRPPAPVQRPAAPVEPPAPVRRPAAPVEPPAVVSVPESEVVEPAASQPDPEPVGLDPAPIREKPKRALRRRLAEAGAAGTTASAAPATVDIDDAKAHEAALETFIRLTESDRQHVQPDEIDQGAVRAALARTAARKKPGGTKLQPHEEPSGERPGGGPRRQ